MTSVLAERRTEVLKYDECCEHGMDMDICMAGDQVPHRIEGLKNNQCVLFRYLYEIA